MSKEYIWSNIFDGDNPFRLNYPLNENSIVFDIGGYKGDFTQNVWNKYKCNIYVFEPIKSFYEDIVNRFKNNPKVKVFNFGFSNKNGDIEIKLQDDSSSIFRVNNCQTEIVKMMKLSDFIKLGRNIDKYCELDRERLLLIEENNKLKENQNNLLHECNRYIAQSESDKDNILHQKELNKCQ